ncbi:MAG TPA: acyl-CoA dehydrogenase family protein [Acidimicrobiia bacterium]|nr:acyl-CoA dehydrogenase family protein [Acidimicrobiia bacterium]
MFLEYSDEQRALRKELREYFARLLTPEVRAGLGQAGEGSPLFRTIVRQMGADGWLGLGWPPEYGGQGRGAIDQFILFDEVQRAGAPFPFVTINTVGPTLMAFGTEEHKRRYLPGILTGDVNFAIGYTEPEAGTDLASLRTRAVLDGDEWLINGNKVFTSGANQADFIWLACRTDPDAPKHKGISIIIVPTDTPGFKCTPIVTVGGTVTQASYYDDVKVPAANLVGERNAGWRLITNQLNHERVGLAALGGLTHRLYDDVVDWSRTTDAGDGTGRRMLDVPWVQADLAKAHALLEAMKLLNWRMAAAVNENTLTPTDASAAKVYGVETQIESYRLFLGILGAVGYLPEGSPGAALRGEVERAGRSAQINTFGGGVVEVLREMVAATGLNMVRQAR